MDKNNVKVTFFLTGEWIEQYPDSVKTILAAGHDIGNHSENHKQMQKLNKEECYNEIMETHNRVKELTGYDMKLFRAPYGEYNQQLIQIIEECGYSAVEWNIDSEDWKDYNALSIIRSVTENPKLTHGSIILMHNGATYTPDALETIIVMLKAEGYTFVPISDMISMDQNQI